MTEELTKNQKQIIKKRIMLKATLFALSIVVATIFFAMLILRFIN
jgi:small neutral amino acid transporter SnatA (MarC family)